MNPSRPRLGELLAAVSRRKSHGFTLVEIMVSVMVLSMLVMLMIQLTDSTAHTISESNKRLDAATQCRLTLDRMAFDFAGMLNRADIDYNFKKDDGNDSLSFYSQTTGLFPPGSSQASVPRVVSVVGYRITNDPQQRPRLERGARGIDWDQMVFTALSGTGQTQSFVSPNSLPLIDDPGVTPSNYQVLGDQIIRFEFCFLTKGNAADPQPRLVAAFPGSLSQISAIVVGIAVLDKRSRVLVSDYSRLANALPDAKDGQDIATLWMDRVNKPDFAKTAGIPLPAAQAITVNQHYFFLK